MTRDRRHESCHMTSVGEPEGGMRSGSSDLHTGTVFSLFRSVRNIAAGLIQQQWDCQQASEYCSPASGCMRTFTAAD